MYTSNTPNRNQSGYITQNQTINELDHVQTYKVQISKLKNDYYFDY